MTSWGSPANQLVPHIDGLEQNVHRYGQPRVAIIGIERRLYSSNPKWLSRYILRVGTRCQAGHGRSSMARTRSRGAVRTGDPSPPRSTSPGTSLRLRAIDTGSTGATGLSSPSPRAHPVTAGAVRSTWAGSAVTCSPPTITAAVGAASWAAAITRFA